MELVQASSVNVIFHNLATKLLSKAYDGSIKLVNYSSSRNQTQTYKLCVNGGLSFMVP